MQRSSNSVTSCPVKLLALAGGAIMAIVLMAAGPIAAQSPDVPPPREYGESGVQTGVVTVRAGSDWLPAGSSGSGGSSSCTSSSARIVVEDDFVQPINRQWRALGSGGDIPFTATPDDLPSSLPAYMRSFSPTGRWYEAICDGNITIVPEGGPSVTIAGLAQQALDQLDPPEPDLAVTPDELHFTQLQSWMAVEPSYWEADRAATASAGRISVTARANPTDAIWEMGDGESVTCTGPGTVWQAGLDVDDTDCAYTYRRTSVGAPGNSFDITATVRFEVTVATNAPGSYGPFELERSTIETIQVGEIQAVND